MRNNQHRLPFKVPLAKAAGSTSSPSAASLPEAPSSSTTPIKPIKQERRRQRSPTPDDPFAARHNSVDNNDYGSQVIHTRVPPANGKALTVRAQGGIIEDEGEDDEETMREKADAQKQRKEKKDATRKRKEERDQTQRELSAVFYNADDEVDEDDLDQHQVAVAMETLLGDFSDKQLSEYPEMKIDDKSRRQRLTTRLKGKKYVLPAVNISNEIRFALRKAGYICPPSLDNVSSRSAAAVVVMHGGKYYVMRVRAMPAVHHSRNEYVAVVPSNAEECFQTKCAGWKSKGFMLVRKSQFFVSKKMKPKSLRYKKKKAKKDDVKAEVKKEQEFPLRALHPRSFPKQRAEFDVKQEKEKEKKAMEKKGREATKRVRQDTAAAKRGEQLGAAKLALAFFEEQQEQEHMDEDEDEEGEENEENESESADEELSSNESESDYEEEADF